MAQILHLIVADVGQLSLWPEDWKSARTACRTVAMNKTPLQYNAAVCKIMLRRMQLARRMMDAARVIENASMAQENRKCFLEQYFYISTKLSDFLWSELRSILSDRADLYFPLPSALAPRRRQHNPGLRVWVLLQEQAAYALGVLPPLAMPERLVAMEYRQTIAERSTIIANFIRKGTATLKRAHSDVAWCAIMTAVMKVTECRLEPAEAGTGEL